MLLLITEPEEEKEKEDVEDNPATKDLNARLASRWHPFDIVLIHRERAERMRVSSRVNIYFCVCLLCLQQKRGEKEKKSEAFDLGYTTLILNASQQKKTKSQAWKGGASLSFLLCLTNYFTSPIKRAPRFKTFIVKTNGERREQEREKKRVLSNKESDFSFVRFFPFT